MDISTPTNNLNNAFITNTISPPPSSIISIGSNAITSPPISTHTPPPHSPIISIHSNSTTSPPISSHTPSINSSSHNNTFNMEEKSNKLIVTSTNNMEEKSSPNPITSNTTSPTTFTTATTANYTATKDEFAQVKHIVIDTKRFARVERIPGGQLSDSYVLDGIIVNKDVLHPKMRRYILNPIIICLDIPMEYNKGESQTNIGVDIDCHFFFDNYVMFFMFFFCFFICNVFWVILLCSVLLLCNVFCVIFFSFMFFYVFCCYII